MYDNEFLAPTLGATNVSGQIDLPDQENVVSDQSLAPQFFSYGMKYAGANQYSVRGWFWFDEPANGGEDNQSVIFVTANNPEKGFFRKGLNWQDFLLVIYITRRDVRFCTYTIGANGNEPGEKITCKVHLLEGVRGEMWWVYTYFAYDRNTKRVFALIKIDG